MSAASAQLVCEIDEQDAVLRHQADEHDRADKREEIERLMSDGERSQRTDGVGAVLEHPHAVRGAANRVPELRERGGQRIVLELLVVAFAARQMLRAGLQARLETRNDAVDRIHRPRIVHVVGGNKRGVEAARRIGMKQLVQKVCLVRRRRIVAAARPGVPKENAVDPEILRARV